MNNRRKTEEYDLLFEAILSLETKEECMAFFDDICTIKGNLMPWHRGLK